MAPGRPIILHWDTEQKVTRTDTSPACQTWVSGSPSLVFLLELPREAGVLCPLYRDGETAQGEDFCKGVKGWALPH